MDIQLGNEYGKMGDLYRVACTQVISQGLVSIDIDNRDIGEMIIRCFN
jgi:hypothetical protein